MPAIRDSQQRRISAGVDAVEQVSLPGSSEAGGKAAGLYASAQHLIVIEGQRRGIEPLASLITQLNLARAGVEGRDKEGGILHLDLAAEMPKTGHEDALFLQEAYAPQQCGVQTPMGHRSSLVFEMAVAPQYEPGGLERGRLRPVASLEHAQPGVFPVRTGGSAREGTGGSSTRTPRQS